MNPHFQPAVDWREFQHDAWWRQADTVGTRDVRMPMGRDHAGLGRTQQRHPRNRFANRLACKLVESVADMLGDAGAGILHDPNAAEESFPQRAIAAQPGKQRLVTSRHIRVEQRRDLAQVANR